MPNESATETRVLDRFESINRARLYRIREILGPEQVLFFDVLPLLLHINRPGLPGYVSRETPAGISRYTPERAALDAARHLFRSDNGVEDGPGLREIPREIQGIYCLGSLGSIAQCPSSDLDVWVCHEPGLEVRRLAELNAKARVVEQWAQGLGLEVHFFLIDPECFRAGQHAQLSVECSGNAQHYLLLDEFYRSSVVLAGRYPLWWRVPPGEEQRYADCAAALWAREPALPCVDFGGLGEIPREEFASAALWQLGKVIDAPCKSVLKLLLLEAYAGDLPRPDVLALRYKACVYEGAVDPERLDPYLLLYRRIEEYLVKKGDAPRLALARRCLLLKARAAERYLPTHAAGAWRARCLSVLCRQWGWSEQDLARLATRDRWGFEAARAEWREIIDSLRVSFRTLTGLTGALAGPSPVTPQEIAVLGRRLHTAFERRPGKFSVLGRGTEWGAAEAILYLHRHAERGGSWGLSRGPTALLRIGETPGELIAWAILNGLCGPHTRWQMDETTTDLSVATVEAMRSFIERGLVRKDLPKPEASDLIAAPRLVSAAVMVGVEPRAERSLPEREPVLWPHYRIRTAEIFLTTSWGERLCLPFRGERALARALCEYLAWPPGFDERVPIEAMVYGAGEADAPDLARRLERILAEAVQVLRGVTGPHAGRYVLAWGSGFCVLEARGGGWHVELLESYAALLRYLGHPLPVFTRTRVQKGVSSCGSLPLVLAENQPGIVQVFLSSRCDHPCVSVLDEHGGLFQETAEGEDAEAFLPRYRRFLQAVLARGSVSHGGDRPSVYYYVLDPDEPGGLKRLAPLPPYAPGPYALRARMIPDADAGRVITLTCCGRELSKTEPGPSAYREAALHLLDIHGDGDPVDVCDIELPGEHSGMSPAAPVIALLQYKHAIEGRLNDALRRIRAERTEGRVPAREIG